MVKDADVAQLVEELAPPLASNGTLARHFCWGLILATNPILVKKRKVSYDDPVANYGAGSLAPSVSKYLHTAWTSRHAYVVQKSASTTRNNTARNRDLFLLLKCSIKQTDSLYHYHLLLLHYYFNKSLLIKYDSSCYYHRCRRSCRNCQCLHT